MKKFTSKYLLVLGVLTLVILGSQLLMQKTIKDSKSDARIINISGRQRMLSQKITKASLKLQTAEDKQAFDLAKSELQAAYKLWTTSHADLQFGSSEIDVSEMNKDQALQALFQQIDPFYTAIKQASEELISMSFETANSSRKNQATDAIAAIKSNEGEFLTLMNKITFQYDKQASAKIEMLSTVEYYLLGTTLLVILMEILFIFRPMFVDSKQKESIISKLSVLRNDEQNYSSTQIKQANSRIKELKKLAIQLKEEVIEKDKSYTLKTTSQMMENLKLKGRIEELEAKLDQPSHAI
ncbi:type IV pili methyl-accepting chemotaxis transducer N-terminal domain-containing protein [Marinoscillum furvescens]|uniref:PilJ/NarX-like methyl-accepting chemotaxis transducer n=1 Tax=Marinoscillum furvescens DSM 4134 TaxID=1122208 RepID=A0A3D9LIH7_MARFU|nr:type IV pili methyl-accepting chemotaxis transducer N-terminal domain-containing protein [Marinoscillum furvescens]REE05623.1 PilJ/NarX-like methyl-accepting chemotaxis transducer [Marinoscillum furvescens DSM 4134]